jgi:uncharacterized membrane-anchored protein
MNKLPPVNIYFWIMIITATTLGETAGDLFSMTMGLGYAVSSCLLIGLFAIALACQLLVKIEHPALYWTVIVLTSTAGTTISDYIDRSLGLGYAKGTLILLTLLIALFTLWRFTARSLAIGDIKTVKTEFLYWAAILISSTLGTALGDFLADDSGLGFGGGTLVLATLLVALATIASFTKVSRVLLFWLAIVVTHPIGATMGDLLTKTKGGLNLGPIVASAILIGIFAGVIIVLRYKKPDHGPMT